MGSGFGLGLALGLGLVLGLVLDLGLGLRLNLGLGLGFGMGQVGEAPIQRVGGTALSYLLCPKPPPPVHTHTLLCDFQRAIQELGKAWQMNNNELISTPSADRSPQQRLAPTTGVFPTLLLSTNRK